MKFYGNFATTVITLQSDYHDYQHFFVIFLFSVPEDEVYKYVCNLSPEMEEVARIELRETENRRDQALEQFRQMIKLHPRIKKCQTGNKNAIKYSSFRKFYGLIIL